ncbi:MAG: tyrosine--tRNA ligase [Chthoniobacterales bacterium]|nr:tyrosine--tRNA ligase [Chthoniobacterales bacterium]
MREFPNPEDQMEVLCRGCEKILTPEELRQKLAERRPLRVKLGVDPTSPDIHLGHTVALAKMRQFQDLGHTGVLILGSFTAMIGDPTGRSVTRPQLTKEEVLANAATYQEQAFKVLDFERTEVVFNGDWFFKMSYEEVLRLNSLVTMQQMLQREDFRERIERGHPIRAHEIQYPIMQGWDSVMVRADVELGGTDQLFNVLVGRDFQAHQGQPLQVAMLMPILVGTDGTQKMSKSLGNAIGVTEEPEQMFGKIMSIPDSALRQYYELLLGETLDPNAHPMEQKKNLAYRIVARFHSHAAAKAALDNFVTRFSKRDLATAELPKFTPPPNLSTTALSLTAAAYESCFGLTPSRSEIRRLIQGGSVQWNGKKLTNPNATISITDGGVLKLDKIRAVRIIPQKS